MCRRRTRRSIHPGVTAKLLVREYPGRDFQATVTRTAGAIDPASRTLLTELQIPNKDGTLYAGMYGEIKFSLVDDANAPIIVPANAYIFRTAGPQVVVVGADGKVHWQTIQVGRDYGTEFEALSGLKDGDKVVMNPTDDLRGRDAGNHAGSAAAGGRRESPINRNSS